MFKELFESPKIIYQLNDKYIDVELIKPLDKAIQSGSTYDVGNEIIQIPVSKTENIFAWVKNNEIIGALKTTSIGIKNIPYTEITLSKKFKLKGFLNHILPVVEKETKSLIISGEEHTSDSIAIWNKFSKFPERYNITSVKALNKKTGKYIPIVKNQIWGTYDSFKNKRIVLSFK